ncbi:MAG TPA: helical backbone metal receptor [Mycobacteriales bacterium]|nr:helical backbone metal receptor [Mycobacteriales bacterium]
MPRAARDDVGTPIELPPSVDRIVSLVPSLTETVAGSGGADRLVGVTDWCTHPPDVVAAIPRVGGTKNPDLARIVALAPDLVLANAEENRAEDLAALRAAGLAVWVTAPDTVSAAVTSLGRLLAVAGLTEGGRGWYRAVVDAWPVIEAPAARRRAVTFIWRRPWMVLGRDTFAGDLLRRLGCDNVYADSPDRYPRVDLDEVRARSPELVVLPDEPYSFSMSDGPEAFAGWDVPVALVSGRHLTWYGPSLAEARQVLTAQLERAHFPQG